jgi:hypothetical protein
MHAQRTPEADPSGFPLSTLGRPPSLVARERRYQPVPSTRNRERSATLVKRSDLGAALAGW